jgi:membrane AbrB-like protein
MGACVLSGRPSYQQWLALLAGSSLLSALLGLLRLPAALLLGPMIAAVLAEVGGGRIRLPRILLYTCQAVIGCMVARALTPDLLSIFAVRWPLLLAVVLSVIATSALLGWLMSRWRILPGTTAVWGLSPGAASAMVLMAGAFGADARLVAFMQYFRVVLVATVATLVARVWGGSQVAASAPPWFPALHAQAFAATLAIALGGGLIGRMARIPAGIFLVPMLIGAGLHFTGIVAIELPPWLLAISYAFLGWSIGLGFTREILAHALRALPQTALAILTLMLFAGGLALVLVRGFGVDPLTAYLATSPGGADSVAIIAASSRVNISFVMAMQTMRFLMVLALGPAVSRFVARHIPASPETLLPEEAKSQLLSQVREDEGELD